VHFAVSSRWLKDHPLSAHLLDKERAEWRELGLHAPATRPGD
jgi:hypothetical protein